MEDKARIIQEVVNQFGWKYDISQLIERVNQLDKGLLQEDEFIYIIKWLGRCKFIHKLDQLHIPSSSKSIYTIPDILVEVETPQGPKVFLIEIKTSQSDKLSWTKRYYEGLQNYSNLLNLPILIAWKWDTFGIWTLFELKHFSKPHLNYKISFETAAKESLLSTLFGDFIVIPDENFGLNIQMKKIKKISEKQNDKGNLEIGWETVIDEVYYSGRDNSKVTEFPKAIFALLTSFTTDEIVVETEKHISNKFVPHPNKMKYAQMIPTTLLRAFSQEDSVNWLQCSVENKEPIAYQELLDGVSNNVDNGLIQYILFTQPFSERQ
jgi:Holliday junction resolvase